MAGILGCRPFFVPMSAPLRILWKPLAAFAAGWLALAPALESAEPRARISYDSFVNWDFKHRKKLQAWRATSEALGRIVRSGDPQARIHARIENGTPEQLRQFLRSLPATSDCEVSVVYLASHQSPAGDWAFPQEPGKSWSELLAGVTVPRHPRRIVILDACFATAARRHPAWAESLGVTCVYAANASEETHELNFRNRLPIDMQRRYPAAAAWVAGNLTANRGDRLSFLGFALAQAFVGSKQPPRQYGDWIEMLRRCEQAAADFRRDTSRRFASEVTLVTSEKTRGPKRTEAD